MARKVLVTGNLGYIGPVMTGELHKRGCSVIGLDSRYFADCEFIPESTLPQEQIAKDMRDVTIEDLKGIDALIHLAGLSNDPLGEKDPQLTHDINLGASVRLAKLAKEAGVERFVFASSCSIYGISDTDKPVTEKGTVKPLTAYAKAKADVETEVSRLADAKFHPVFMRNATVYGVAPRIRLDLVVNNLVAAGFLTGKISILSDGTPWRPIVHVSDFCRAAVAAMEAPAAAIHNEVFNVGLNEENYQVKDIANMVGEIVPGCTIEILNKTGSDERSYRVDFSKIKQRLPGFKPEMNLMKGVEELYRAYKEGGLKPGDFTSNKYFRIRWLNHLTGIGKLDDKLYWNSVNG